MLQTATNLTIYLQIKYGDVKPDLVSLPEPPHPFSNFLSLYPPLLWLLYSRSGLPSPLRHIKLIFWKSAL